MRLYLHGREGQWAWHWHSPSFDDTESTGSYRGRSCAQDCFEIGHSGMMQAQRETIGGSTSSPGTNQAWQSLCDSVSFHPLHLFHLFMSLLLGSAVAQWFELLSHKGHGAICAKFTCDLNVCRKLHTYKRPGRFIYRCRTASKTFFLCMEALI